MVLKSNARAFEPATVEASCLRTVLGNLHSYDAAIVIAHPDDAEFGCYALIRKCMKEGKRLLVIVVTTGSKCPLAGSFADRAEEMERIRAEEQFEAARIGNYSVLMLGYESADLRGAGSDLVCGVLEQILSQCSAAEIWTHNPFDRHPTHLSVLRLLLAAIRRMNRSKRPTKLYGAELWGGLDHVPAEHIEEFDVSDDLGLRRALIEAFRSQNEAKNYAAGVPGREAGHATFRASHSNNRMTACDLALNMAPLLEDDTLSLEDWTKQLLDKYVRVTLSLLHSS